MHEEVMLAFTKNSSDLIQAGFESVTVDMCTGWITYCGYT